KEGDGANSSKDAVFAGEAARWSGENEEEASDNSTDEKGQRLDPGAPAREHESRNQAQGGKYHDKHAEAEAEPHHGLCFLHDHARARQGWRTPWTRAAIGDDDSAAPRVVALLRLRRTIRARPLRPYLFDVGERAAQLFDPGGLVATHELDAPRERFTAAPGDAGIYKGVQHLPLGHPKARHDRHVGRR